MVVAPSVVKGGFDMYWDSFDCEINSDEFIPEEYEDYMRWVYGGAPSTDNVNE